MTGPTERPTARLGYAVGDLEAFVHAGERRMAELADAIADAETRRDDARRRVADASTRRQRIAEEWLQTWEDANASPGSGVGA